MNKETKIIQEYFQTWCSSLSERIAIVKAVKADKEEMRFDFPLPAHRATVTVSLVEAVVAILNHLGLELERREEIVATRKKKRA